MGSGHECMYATTATSFQIRRGIPYSETAFSSSSAPPLHLPKHYTIKISVPNLFDPFQPLHRSSTGVHPLMGSPPPVIIPLRNSFLVAVRTAIIRRQFSNLAMPSLALDGNTGKLYCIRMPRAWCCLTCSQQALCCALAAQAPSAQHAWLGGNGRDQKAAAHAYAVALFVADL